MKKRWGKHIFSSLSTLPRALPLKHFRVKTKCIFLGVFFSQRRVLTTFICFLFIKCSVLYIWNDNLLFLLLIFTKLVNTPLSLGKLHFNLMSLISGPAVLMSLNLPIGMKDCRQAVSCFYLQINNFM